MSCWRCVYVRGKDPVNAGQPPTVLTPQSQRAPAAWGWAKPLGSVTGSHCKDNHGGSAEPQPPATAGQGLGGQGDRDQRRGGVASPVAPVQGEVSAGCLGTLDMPRVHGRWGLDTHRCLRCSSAAKGGKDPQGGEGGPSSAESLGWALAGGSDYPVTDRGRCTPLEAG